MAGTSIAKAYVQIVPSAQGIKGQLSKALGSEAANAGKSSGKTAGNSLVDGLKSAMGSVSKVVGNAFKAAAKVGVAGLGGATAGIAAFSKSALDAYADYEQLVGGVETLFGSSAATVMQYADQAFQSAGLSANDYMETVTSFSASLLQSLNQDTGKAAEYANQALVDMSDNANKMGTDMRDIQNAYQGFAKQNYTMLDNLKLGYGGTKEEMERLIEDANKLKKANGETANLSIKSFADIVEAIHLVQTEMGITGTTAEEASTTIQGSVGAMKAAWTNLTVGVADDTQDFEKLVDNFVASTVTAASNILPRLEKILSGTGDLITSLAPVITAAVPVLVESVLPGVIDAGISLVAAFVSAIVSSGPTLVQTAMDGIQTILTQALGMSEDTASGILGILQSMLDGAGQIVSAVGDAIGTVMDTVNSIMSDAGIAWTDVWSGIAAGISAAAAVIGGVITGIADGIAWVVAEAQTDGTILSYVWAAISDAVSGAWEIIQTAIDAIATALEYVANEAQTDGTAINLAWTALQSAVETVGDAVGTAIDLITEAFDYFVSDSEEGSSLFSAAFQAASNGVAAAVLFVSECINALGVGISWLVDEATTDGTLLNSIWENIKNAFGSVLDAIMSILDAFIALFHGDIAGFGENLLNAIDSILSGLFSAWDAGWSMLLGVLDTVLTPIVNAASAAWNNIKSSASEIWNSIKSTITSVVNNIKSTVTSVFNAVKTAISTPLTSAKNTVSSIFNSIKSTISDKINGAKTAVHNAIEAIKSKFNFSWSLPKLKLPHVTISGSFSISPPSVPKFGISWYAKAMNAPVLLRNATIFGAAGGNLLGGGEAGSEVVSGTETLMRMIRGATGGELAVGISSLEDKLDRVILLLARLSGVTINVNGSDYRSKMELAEALMDLIERDRARREAAL